MAGVSEMPFRVLARRLGAGAAPTELVSAKGLLYGQERTAHYLTHDPSESPFWVQIFGGDPDSMAAGAECAVNKGAKILDINMGCPVRKVTKNGAGSALLCDTARAASLVEAMVKRTHVPVTVKIRAGWEQPFSDFSEITRRFADAGCAAIAMHARTRAQGYSGKADWSLISRLVEVSSLPIIGNGDVRSVADANRMRAETGCAAVMIGRAALGNPWIFEQLTTGVRPPSPTDRWRLIREHLEAHLRFVGDVTRGIRRFRPHLLWYAHGLQNAAAFRSRATTINDLDLLIETAQEFFTSSQGDTPTDFASFELGAALG